MARVSAEPPLAGTVVDRSVPLAAGPCGDWRAALKAGFEPGRTRFAGTYPTACGELAWPVADPQPATYDARLIEALWREMGGQLHGARARRARAPADLPPSFEWRSPPLAEVVRDINKFSNNLMAQQLFLTLALQAAPQQPATPEAARDAHELGDRAHRRVRAGQAPRRATQPGRPPSELVIDNGSGLSRSTRISAQRLARLLLQAYDSPVMSEFMSSLPISGLDGTLRRSRATPGRAHLKTGSLRDVAGVAGYVLSDSGRRYVLVAIVNHPQAGCRPAGARRAGAVDAARRAGALNAQGRQNGLRWARSTASVASCAWPPLDDAGVVGPQVGERAAVGHQRVVSAQRQRHGAHACRDVGEAVASRRLCDRAELQVGLHQADEAPVEQNLHAQLLVEGRGQLGQQRRAVGVGVQRPSPSVA